MMKSLVFSGQIRHLPGEQGGKVKVSFSHFMHNTSKLTAYKKTCENLSMIIEVLDLIVTLIGLFI